MIIMDFIQLNCIFVLFRFISIRDLLVSISFENEIISCFFFFFVLDLVGQEIQWYILIYSMKLYFYYFRYIAIVNSMICIVSLN
jgi:hypothetical protein